MSVTKLNSAAMKDLIDAALDINNTTYYNVVMGSVVQNLSKVMEDLNNTKESIENTLEAIDDDMPDLNNMTSEALTHASNLRTRVSWQNECFLLFKITSIF